MSGNKNAVNMSFILKDSYKGKNHDFARYLFESLHPSLRFK